MPKQLISMNEFARRLGEHARLTRDASLPLHEGYVAADAAQQGEMRVSWLLNHLTGQGYTQKQAEAICSASRTERSAEAQRDYDKARQDFAYHIVRKTKSNKAEEKKPRISREERSAWAAFVSTVGADRAALIAKTLG